MVNVFLNTILGRLPDESSQHAVGNGASVQL